MQTQNDIILQMIFNWKKPTYLQRWTCKPGPVFVLLQAFTLFPFKKTKTVLKTFFENPTNAYDYVPVYLTELTQADADELFQARGSPRFYFSKISANLKQWILHDILVFNRKWKAEIRTEIPSHLLPLTDGRSRLFAKNLEDWQLVNITLMIYGLEFLSLTSRLEQFLTEYQAMCILNPKSQPRIAEPVNEDELMEIGFIKAEEVCPLCKGPAEGTMLSSTICKHTGAMHEKCYAEYEQYRINNRKVIECPFNGCSLNLSRPFLRSSQIETQMENIADLSKEYIVID